MLSSPQLFHPFLLSSSASGDVSAVVRSDEVWPDGSDCTSFGRPFKLLKFWKKIETTSRLPFPSEKLQNSFLSGEWDFLWVRHFGWSIQTEFSYLEQTQGWWFSTLPNLSRVHSSQDFFFHFHFLNHVILTIETFRDGVNYNKGGRGDLQNVYHDVFSSVH